jgi:hypothetical protein
MIDDRDPYEEMEDDDDADGGEEVDELQDDSSLNAESDAEEARRGGRKRRRRLTPPTRVSARKRPRRDEEATKQNGTKANATAPLPVAPKAGLKGSKGQSTKFWYFEEGSAAPAKRPPEMLDDPDAMLKRRRPAKKGEKPSESGLSMQSMLVPPVAQVESTAQPVGLD